MKSETSSPDKPSATTSHPPAKKREWHPRIWEGCDFFAWLRLLVRNRFAVHWKYWYIAIIVTFVSFGHTILKWVQWLIYGRRVARTEIRHQPVFIIGHWRTGTTLLHEFFVLDPRHTYPNTYECMEPNHFLLTENFIKRYLGFLAPTHRPMDNMAAGFDRPQEDEFALCMMGQPSPYLKIAFPDHPAPFDEYFSLEGIPQSAVESWKRCFLRFLKQLTFKDPRRLVLKSPPHTCRIKVLLDMFPDARFVHIVRNPYIVFPSTVRLWKSLWRAHGLQPPNYAGIEEYVYTNFLRLYEKLEESRPLLKPNRFCEVRYEELVRNPVETMRRIYEQLELGGFDEYQPKLEEYLESIKDYTTNQYQITPELRAEINKRWGKFIRLYGYDDCQRPKRRLPLPKRQNDRA